MVRQVQMKGRDGNQIAVNGVKISSRLPLPVRLPAAYPVILFAPRINPFHGHLMIDAFAQSGDRRALQIIDSDIGNIDIQERSRRKSLFQNTCG